MYKLEDPNNNKEIKKEVMRFYRELIGTIVQRTKQIDIVASKDGAQLQDIHINNLIQLVTDQEIWTTLKGIGDTKTPGIDEYNDKLFKKTWNIIDGDLK